MPKKDNHPDSTEVETTQQDLVPANDEIDIDDDHYTPEEHRLGLELQKMMPTTVAHILLVGSKLSEAHTKLSKRGPDSLYPQFCADFLPTLDQKTLDRWRLSFEGFRNLVPIDEKGTDCPYLSNVRLTAMYQLTKPGVTDEQRKAALAVAETGTIVTERIAASIINANGSGSVSKTKTASIHRKTLLLPSGKVRIAINHEDFKQALQEALTFV